MIPPVSQCASAFSVNNDRSTASDQSPVCLNVAVQSAQKDSTCASESTARMGSGAARKDGVQLNVKPISCPDLTSNSPTVFKSSPHSATVVSNNSLSGPAVNCSRPSSWRKTHGTTEPYSKRTTSSVRMRTVPRTPRTIRSRSETPSRRAMKSTTHTAPSTVSKVVSRINVWPQ